MMPFDGRIRVLVVHADPIAQAGLSSACSRYADLEVQDTHARSDGAQPPFRPGPHGSVDVVVADYTNGVALAARYARDSGPSPKVLVIAGIDREWEIRNALQLGVRGFLLVGCALDELAAGVRAVHRGARHLSPQVAARLAESVSREPFTAREEEVLRLVAEGLSNKAIATRLGIAVGTVKSHLKPIFDKLQVQSRTQAVTIVERHGLLGARGQPVQASPGTDHKRVSLIRARMVAMQ
jgi:DNA-binding NarL/FixJ family response regulator